MPEARQYIAQFLLQTAAAEWLTTLGLVFGGCCSNAWALELATSQNPHAGTLITFAQFLLVSLYGLRKHLVVSPMHTPRKDVIRLVWADILALRAKKPRREWVSVAVEGPPTAAALFNKELADTSTEGVHVALFTCPSGVEDVFSRLATVDVRDVVLVNGEHLHTSEARGRWDYSVFLREGGSHKDVPSSGSALTVDISTPTRPVIVSPARLSLYDGVLSALPRIRLKARSIPISRWAVQVALFLLTSLLNNAAFAYNVPMAVHIIFRSGGLVVNMLMGWLIDGRSYDLTQVLSVILVTLGVACTTLSASQPTVDHVSASSASPGSYFVGILLLTLALVMSGLMGLAQDRTYARYGRGHWQEAMFYLHFLALPGFAFLGRDLARQVRTVNASARIEVGLPIQTFAQINGMPRILQRRISIPSFYFPLLLNVMTQLVCVSGVHRLTSRVNSLTVTLVLVVRKAVSLGISVVLLRKGRGGGAWLWAGAGLVLVGTVGYTVGGKRGEGPGRKKE